jgi:hypothetical protein
MYPLAVIFLIVFGPIAFVGDHIGTPFVHNSSARACNLCIRTFEI